MGKTARKKRREQRGKSNVRHLKRSLPAPYMSYVCYCRQWWEMSTGEFADKYLTADAPYDLAQYLHGLDAEGVSVGALASECYDTFVNDGDDVVVTPDEHEHNHLDDNALILVDEAGIADVNWLLAKLYNHLKDKKILK